MKLNLLIWGLVSHLICFPIFSQPLILENSTELPSGPEGMMILKNHGEPKQFPLGNSTRSVNKMPNIVFRTPYYLYQVWEFLSWKDVDSVSNTFLQDDIIDNALEFGFDGINWNQKFRYQYTYDADFVTTAMQIDTFDAQSWRPYSQSLWGYNSDGYETFIAYDTWSDTAWYNVSRYDIDYDSNNNLTSWQESRNLNMIGLEPFARANYIYDSLDRRVSYISSYNSSGTGLENSIKQISFYDSSSVNVSTSLNHNWDGLQWVEKSQSVFSYYGELLSTWLTQEPDSGQWVDVRRTVYAYNADSLNISRSQQTWNGTNWLDNYRFTFSYVNALLSVRMYQTHDGVSFVNESRELFMRTSSDLMEEYISQSWGGSQWENNDREEFEYDDDDNLIRRLYQNGVVTSWENVRQYIYTYEAYDSTTTTLNGLLNPVDHKVYPNPFNDQLTIEYNNDSHETANLIIYSIDGKMIMGIQASNSFDKITWKGTDAYGKELPNGMYTYKLSLGDKVSTGKVVLNR